MTATYDSRGNMTSVSGGGSTWSATYAGVELLSATDPLSRTVSLAYGDANQPHVPTGFTDELGLTTWLTHNAYGQTLTVTDPQNHTGSVVYDETTGPNRGYPLYATDANGDLVSFDSYDGLGDLTSLSTFPIHGNTAVKNTTQLLWDAAQRLIRVTHPDGKTSQAIYSGHNLSYTLDEQGTRYDYGFCAPCGLLASIAGPLGWNLHWAYDNDKDLTSFTDARGKVTSYQYGAAGDLNRISYPDGTYQSVKYDQSGRVTDAHQSTDLYDPHVDYNAMGDPSALSTVPVNGGGGGGIFQTMDYYADGSLQSVRQYASGYQGIQQTTWTYTARGQVQTVAYSFTDWSGGDFVFPTQTLTYAYNPDGSRSSLTWSGVGTWTYGYDAGGRLTSVTNPWNETTSWGYDGEGKLTSQVNANGTSTVYGYNQARGWPTSIQQKVGANPFASYNLTYDNGLNTVGLLTGVSESSGAASYGYDALYRLTSESRTGAGANSHTHGYDLAGNRTSFDGQPRAFDDANKQTSGGLSYDSHGNTTALPYQSLGWNLLDQLSYSQTAQAVNCTYTYDGLGRRILRRTNLGPTTIYLFDGDLLLGEVTHSNVYPNAVSTSAVYTWGAAGLVSERIPSGSLFYHFGPQGETRQLTNASGAVVDTYLYTAYGQPVSTTGTDPNPFRYGGQFGYYTDTDPGNGGLILCGARWYSPSLGRWLSRDPSGYGGGWNLYEYCSGDPLDFMDCTGLAPRGHHYAPKPVRQYPNLSSAARSYFNNTTTGFIPNHNYSHPHPAYNKAALEEFQTWLEAKKINPAKMTTEEAAAFIEHLRSSSQPLVRNFITECEAKAAEHAATKLTRTLAGKAGIFAAAGSGVGAVARKAAGKAGPLVSAGFFIYDWYDGGFIHAIKRFFMVDEIETVIDFYGRNPDAADVMLKWLP